MSLTICDTETGSINTANSKFSQELDKISVYFAINVTDILISCLLFQMAFITTIPHDNLYILHPLPSSSHLQALPILFY